MSPREAIMDAVMARLAGTTGVGVHLYRSRTAAIRAEATLSLNVRPMDEEAGPSVVGYTDRSLTVELQVRARGDIPDAIADDTLASAHAKMLADTTLGGTAIYVEEIGTTWELDEADTDLCEISTRYRIRYRTDYLQI